MRILLYFTLLLVVLYFSYRLFSTGTFEVGLGDWGIDMGYTQLGQGLILFGFAALLLFYFQIKKPTAFRGLFKGMDRTMLVLVTTPIALVLVLYLGFHVMAHDFNLDLYRLNIFWGNFDKFNHFFFALVLTIVALKISPSRTTLLLIFLIAAFYELFEVVFIYTFATMPYEIWLFPEIEDVVSDVTINTLGIVLGWFIMRKSIKR